VVLAFCLVVIFLFCCHSSFFSFFVFFDFVSVADCAIEKTVLVAALQKDSQRVPHTPLPPSREL
jgi:hypothetical protein